VETDSAVSKRILIDVGTGDTDVGDNDEGHNDEGDNALRDTVVS